MEELTVFEVNELVASVQNISVFWYLLKIQVDITMQDANYSSIIMFARIFTFIYYQQQEEITI